MRRFRKWTPKEKRDEVVLRYLTGDNSIEELGEYYNVNPATIRTWIKRFRHSKKVVSLQAVVFLVVNHFRKMSTKLGMSCPEKR